MSATSTITGPITEPTDVRGPAEQGDLVHASLFVKAARIAVQLLFRLFFRVRVKGLRNLPKTPFIICSNHLGWADPFLILCFLPVEPRIYALGYSLNYIEDPGAKAFRKRVIDSLRVMVALRVDRPLEAFHTMRDILKRGGRLLLFAEGTYMGAQEGKLMDLQVSAAQLSQLSGVPLLPVGLTGTKELWFRRTLTVRIGKPIHPEDFTGSLRDRTDSMTVHLARAITALLPGDHERARVRLLRNWLTMLFYGEETFTRSTKHSSNGHQAQQG